MIKISNWTILLLLFGVATCGYAQTKANFSIHGFGKGDASNVYLLYYSFEDDTKIVDSTKVKGGKFSFEGQIGGPSYGGILFGQSFDEASNNWGDSNNIWFTLFKGDTNIDFGGSKPEIKGGNAGLDLVRDFHSLRQEKRAVYESAEFKADQALAKQKRDELKALDSQMVAKYGRREDLDFRVLKEFLGKYPNEEFSLYKFKEFLSNSKSYEESQALFALLSDSMRNSTVGKKLGYVIETFNIKEESPAIPFSQADTNGTLVHLEDFKGKYVLVDFWASWCVPCRAENPNLVKAYQQFKSKNFEILGVSFDNKKESWLDAIHKDNLAWPQVSDLKGWKNEVGVLYGIRSIPANFLINPDGKIIAKNLRGDQLIETLTRELK